MTPDSPTDPAPSGDVDLRLLPLAFFARPTVVVARDLLGKVLLTRLGGVLTGGRVVETEAYLGKDDPGSHAATRGITRRNRVMYGPPGRAYVYFTYGNHHMLNVVTEHDGVAGAVLVRAIEPLFGLETMLARRAGHVPEAPARGPGCVAQALGVDLSLNDTELGGIIAIADAPPVDDDQIVTTGRIGLRQGYELPLRFYVRGNPHVSRASSGAAPERRGAHPRGDCYETE